MVGNIDCTIFVSIYPFVSLFVRSFILFDCSFAHLFVCSCVCGRVVVLSSGRLMLCSAGRLFVCFFGFWSFVRVVVWSFGHFVRLIFWSFLRVFVCIRFVYFLSFQRVVSQKLFTSMEYPKVRSSAWVCCSLPRKKSQMPQVKTARHQYNV